MLQEDVIAGNAIILKSIKNYIQWSHEMTLKDVDWNAISPVIYIVLGLAVVGVIAAFPDAKDPGCFCLVLF
jgi:hypothetical protein